MAVENFVRVVKPVGVDQEIRPIRARGGGNHAVEHPQLEFVLEQGIEELEAQ